MAPNRVIRSLRRQAATPTRGVIPGRVLGGTPVDGGGGSVTFTGPDDWDNAQSEEYVSHPAEQIAMTPGVDGFEDLSYGDQAPAAWSPDEAVVTDYVAAEGQVSVRNDASASGEGSPLLGAQIDGATPTQVTWAYYETSRSGGNAYWVENTSGDTILALGTANPQFGYTGGDGGEEMINSPNPEYEEWRLATVTFDWGAETFDVLWEDLTGSSSPIESTGNPFMNSASGIGEVGMGEWRDIGGQGNAVPNGGAEWTDNIYGVPIHSTLTTPVKSFPSPQTPNIENAVYALNSGNVTLDVTGSPGGESETVSASLGGEASAELSWSSSHTDFQVDVILESTDRDPALTPTVTGFDLAA